MTPLYVSLNLVTGALTVTGDRNSPAVRYGRELMVSIPPGVRVAELLAAIAPTAQRVVAGARLVGGGDHAVGSLTLAGEEAHDDLVREIESWTRTAA